MEILAQVRWKGDAMEIRLKPLFPEGDEAEANPLDVAEATRLCKEAIQVYITEKRAYTTGDVVHALFCKCYEARKPSLPFEETSRLARLYAQEAGWRVRTIDLRHVTTALHYPTERVFRAWLQENLPHAMEIAVRRPTKGKPGREDTTADIAAFRPAKGDAAQMAWEIARDTPRRRGAENAPLINGEECRLSRIS